MNEEFNANKYNTRLMSAKDVAEYLNVSIDSSYSILHNVELPTITIGNRIYTSQVQLDEFVFGDGKKHVEKVYRH